MEDSSKELTHIIPEEVASVNDLYGFTKAREARKQGKVVKSETISSGVFMNGQVPCTYHAAYIEIAVTKKQYDEWVAKATVQKFGNTLHKA